MKSIIWPNLGWEIFICSGNEIFNFSCRGNFVKQSLKIIIRKLLFVLNYKWGSIEIELGKNYWIFLKHGRVCFGFNLWKSVIEGSPPPRPSPQKMPSSTIKHWRRLILLFFIFKMSCGALVPATLISVLIVDACNLPGIFCV